MKIIYLGLLVLSFFSYQDCDAQSSIKAIVAQGFRHDNFAKSDIFVNQEVIELVLNKNTASEVDSMLQIIQQEQKENDYLYSYALIKALGFIAKETDVQIIQMLEEQAQISSYLRTYATEALFRIGGKPLERTLNYILSLDNINYQINAIDLTWVIDEPDDLIAIKTILTEHLQKNPNQQFNNFLLRDYLIKFDFALAVSKQKNIPKLQEELKKIIAYEKAYFNAVPGTSSSIWATKRLVDITPVEEKATLIEYLKKHQHYADAEGTPKEFICFQLFRLGASLGDRDRSILASRTTAKTGGESGGFTVFQDKEELKDYYQFRASLKK